VLGLVEAAGSDSIIVAKGNCGIPEYRDGHIHYSGTPEIMGIYAAMAQAAGARIVGGCCGTQPVHLQAMRRALDGPRVPTPDLASLDAALGPIIMPTATEAGARRRRARG
jgi:5-methyltetrahydrofolate--homocysteine methyltransferase